MRPWQGNDCTLSIIRRVMRLHRVTRFRSTVKETQCDYLTCAHRLQHNSRTRLFSQCHAPDLAHSSHAVHRRSRLLDTFAPHPPNMTTAATTADACAGFPAAFSFRFRSSTTVALLRALFKPAAVPVKPPALRCENGGELKAASRQARQGRFVRTRSLTVAQELTAWAGSFGVP
jgi:hypothetical protein